jgi:hypothetical protein
LRESAKITGEGGISRPSLRNGFTAYFALSSVSRTLLSPSSARRECIVANLAPATGRQDHTSIFWSSVKHAETKEILIKQALFD